MRSLSDALRSFLPAIVAREILAAREGIKVARTGLKRHTAERLKLLGSSSGFCVVVGNEECFPKRDRAKGGWCNGIRQGRVRGPGFLNAYVAKTERLARDAHNAEASGDDCRFGELLGTPACCRAFYDRVGNAAALDQNDYFPFSAPSSPADRPSALLNLGAQYFDTALISHFPCSMSCKSSIELARTQARMMNSYDRKWLSETMWLLNHATLYTEYMGVFLLPLVGTNRDGSIVYDNSAVLGTSNARLFRTLAQGNVVSLKPSGHLNIAKCSNAGTTMRPRNVRLYAPAPVSTGELLK